ncbi:MAG: ECF transporter S component [Lachnospiraceae bacterium]|nr:ECF transporter S component [Lachnospiraceae bacterium]
MHYAFPVLAVAVLSCVPLFYSFEKRENSAGELIVLAVLVAISALGRFLFAWLPSFKPVAAITIIAGIWLGMESGFVVGSLSAVVSNFYFGQGPWTPFQMFAWGFIGFLAGVLSKPLRKNKLILALFGALAGILYSLILDIWTVLWADGVWNPERYLTAVGTSFVVMIEYAVSNVIFCLLLAKPIGEKLDRIRVKYGLFLRKEEAEGS